MSSRLVILFSLIIFTAFKIEAQSSTQINTSPTPTPLASPILVTGTDSADAAGATEPMNTLPPLDKNTYLRFDPQSNGIKIPSPVLEYEVNEDAILVGSIKVSEETVKIFLGNPSAVASSLKPFGHLFTERSLYISLPLAVFSHGAIDIIGESGQVIWHHIYTPEELSNSETIRNASKKKKPINYLITELPEEVLPQLYTEGKKRLFRFCLRLEEEDYFSQMCTPPHRISAQTKKIKSIGEVTSTKIYLNNKDAKAQDIVSVPFDRPTHFFGNSSNQYTFEFKSVPRKLFVTDIFKDKDSDTYIFTGHTHFPDNPNTISINPDNQDSFLYKIDWLDTIGDLKKYWRTRIETKRPVIYLSSSAGGQYSYIFQIDKAPASDKRVYVDERTLDGTYASTTRIYGTAPVGLKISSKQKNAKLTNESKGRFYWDYATDSMGTTHFKNLIIKDDDNNWNATYPVYKGFNNEFSLRYAGILTQKLQANTLGEVAFNHWFESLLGLENKFISKQRWGISVKSMVPLQSHRISKRDLEPVSLKVSSFDIKYRFTPGLWERDESWGLIGGYEDVYLNSVQAPLLGVGFFWARSMPKLFDDLFNYFVLFQYPKWVDLDFTYYSRPLKQEIESQATFALNFHGKILWTKYFFGEAGFGIKSYDFKDYKQRRISRLQVFYGTFGLGLNF